jgi:hypothetical protein
MSWPKKREHENVFLSQSEGRRPQRAGNEKGSLASEGRARRIVPNPPVAASCEPQGPCSHSTCSYYLGVTSHKPRTHRRLSWTTMTLLFFRDHGKQQVNAVIAYERSFSE